MNVPEPDQPETWHLLVDENYWKPITASKNELAAAIGQAAGDYFREPPTTAGIRMSSFDVFDMGSALVFDAAGNILGEIAWSPDIDRPVPAR